MENKIGKKYFCALFLFFAASLAKAGNLENCYNPRDSSIEANRRVCEEVGKDTILIYPDPVQVGVGTGAAAKAQTIKVSGCYSLNFERISDIPGDEITGRCTEARAPIRYFLRYRTTCPNSYLPTFTGKCTHGSMVHVTPVISVDGPTIFGEGFNPMLSLGMPIKLSASVASFTAAESCEVLIKTDPSWVYSPDTQSCRKTPAAVCEEIGYHWSELDDKCIAAHVDATHGFSNQCDPSVCAADVRYCRGEPFVPFDAPVSADKKNCYCPGNSVDLDRDLASSSSDDKGACRWLHYDVQMNPVCQDWNDPVSYVADPNNPSKDRCCIGGVCDGFTVPPGSVGADLVNTTPKKEADNPAVPRNFYQIGPTDSYPTGSYGKSLDPSLIKK